MTLTIEPMAEPLGAWVGGWQPQRELSAVEHAAILRGLRQYQVLVFRGHGQPTDVELSQFARGFGQLIKGSEWFGDIGDHAEILPVNNIKDKDGVPLGTGGAAALEWHTDYSYVSTVGKESFLEAVELPESAPQTCFCSQYVALETLPRATVNLLRSMTAFHSTRYSARGKKQIGMTPSADNRYGPERAREDFLKKKARNARLGIKQPRIPEATHPVVLRHPDSGRELLYVNPGITQYIVDMPTDESAGLLQELFAHSTQEGGVYAHDWKVGDMVMFDTLGTLYRRDAWDPTEKRAMRQLSTLWNPNE